MAFNNDGSKFVHQSNSTLHSLPSTRPDLSFSFTRCCQILLWFPRRHRNLRHHSPRSFRSSTAHVSEQEEQVGNEGFVLSLSSLSFFPPTLRFDLSFPPADTSRLSDLCSYFGLPINRDHLSPSLLPRPFQLPLRRRFLLSVLSALHREDGCQTGLDFQRARWCWGDVGSFFHPFLPFARFPAFLLPNLTLVVFVTLRPRSSNSTLTTPPSSTPLPVARPA